MAGKAENAAQKVFLEVDVGEYSTDNSKRNFFVMR